jgi:hypothetical protein
MLEVARRLVFAFPFGCLTALLSHQVRFGDDHAFGGEANEAIVSAAVGGSIAIAVGILHAFLTAGSTTVTGTLANVRVRAMLPNSPLIFGLGFMLYYGIELLEGNGIELGLPTALLAGIAVLVAVGLRRLCAGLARFVDTMVRELAERLSTRPFALVFARANPQLPPAQALRAGRRLGRAPPLSLRLS